MDNHTVYGHRILSQSPRLAMAAEIALNHHEKWDGSGYPNGIKGEEISVEGRIVAIADVFDALTSKRPYKEAWSVEKTVLHMQEQAGTHFDPALIELLVKNLDDIIAIKNANQES